MSPQKVRTPEPLQQGVHMLGVVGLFQDALPQNALPQDVLAQDALLQNALPEDEQHQEHAVLDTIAERLRKIGDDYDAQLQRRRWKRASSGPLLAVVAGVGVALMLLRLR